MIWSYKLFLSRGPLTNTLFIFTVRESSVYTKTMSFLNFKIPVDSLDHVLEEIRKQIKAGRLEVNSPRWVEVIEKPSKAFAFWNECSIIYDTNQIISE